MEVFLRNVPLDLSEKNLRQELNPFMNALGITDWVSEKSRLKKIAWITFLNPSDGTRFLQKHGQIESPLTNTFLQPRGLRHFQGYPRSTPRLEILRTAVYVQKSTRAVDSSTLSRLKYERKERARTVNRENEEPKAISIAVGRIACGHNLFLDDESKTLVFAQQLVYCSSATARFNKRLLAIKIGKQRMDFAYETIQDLIVGYENKTIYLVLTEPPKVYTAIDDAQPKGPKFERVNTLDQWRLYGKLPAYSLVYEITVTERHLNQSIATINSLTLLSITHHDLPMFHGQHYLESEYSENTQKFDAEVKSLLSSGILPFAILFQVQGLVWNNYLLPFNGLKMLERLEQVSQDAKDKNKPLPVTVESIKPLFQSIPYPCPGTDPDEMDVVELVEWSMKLENDMRAANPYRDEIYGTMIHQQHVWVFRATVTPTRILLQGPHAESKNRVLRMYPKYNDYFLRVNFCEENGDDLNYNPKVSNDDIYERYSDVLRRGIVVVGRNYSFLGFSHSSLRSHSAWFSAPFIDENDKEQNYDTILKSLGDFEGIRTPAKCAARIGQAFSETPYAIPLARCGITVRYIPDVKSANGTRVFSDGVGTISEAALEEVWAYLATTPTCLQIRMGGLKGMLSLDTRLPGKIICVRKESMEKFPSDDMDLGICDTASKPLRLFLNRQMIKILEDMGTDREWFIQEQDKAVEVLRKVTSTALNTSTFMRYQSIGTSMGFSQLIKKLDKMNIDYRRDKFLKSVVEHVVLRELRLIKHKARIPIEHGVTLFGIMDETGFLEEGQVYITYDTTYRRNHYQIQAALQDGPVLVTRSPALHPGDVQIATMVSPPEGHPLRSLKNCIAFSQKGSRDLPSQLSGGDLDGDIYNIIWDHKAWPKCCFSPADYPRVIPPSLDRPVVREDMADFFVNFMKSDLLGVIATRHMILADISSEGTKAADCQTLARMHSTAVDFSKTGISVNYEDIPKPPRTRPDFLATAPPVKCYDVGQIDHIADLDEEDEEDGMSMAAPKYHMSEKINGKLYRSIDEEKIWKKDIHLKVNTAGPSVWDQILGLVEKQIQSHNTRLDYRKKVDEAWKIRNLYESFLDEKMLQYSDNPRVALSETEVFCGSILNKRGSQTRRQRDSSIKLKDEIDRITTLIVKQIRDISLGNDDKTEVVSVSGSVTSANRTRDDILELCWACVRVGCVKESEKSHLGAKKFQSFKVLAACCLFKELDAFFRRKEVIYGDGGGYLGVSSGRREVTVPIR